MKIFVFVVIVIFPLIGSSHECEERPGGYFSLTIYPSFSESHKYIVYQPPFGSFILKEIYENNGMSIEDDELIMPNKCPELLEQIRIDLNTEQTRKIQELHSKARIIPSGKYGPGIDGETWEFESYEGFHLKYSIWSPEHYLNDEGILELGNYLIGVSKTK